MNKQYKLAVVCGRFQPLHNGHVDVIKKALAMADKVGLYVGSCNNVGNATNPFSFEERKNFIESTFPKAVKEGKLIIKPLYDREHPADDISWGKFYMDCIHKDFGTPDLFVYGNDKERNRWFTEDDLVGIDTVVVNRKSIEISATEIRNSCSNDVFSEFSSYAFFVRNTPAAMWPKFDFIKNRIVEVSK